MYFYDDVTLINRWTVLDGINDDLQKDLSDKELLVSGSDDAKIYLWQPESSSKPLKRMDGHMQGGVVIDVKFSPDGRIIASASFDHSIRLWHGQTGV